MTDPFSITVGALALLKATKIIVQTGRAAANASKEFEPLEKELTAVEELIARVKRCCSDGGIRAENDLPYDLWIDLQSAIEVAKAKALEAQELIHYKLVKHTTSPNSSGAGATIQTVPKRFSVAKRVREVHELKKELVDVRVSLRKAAGNLDQYLQLREVKQQVVSVDAQLHSLPGRVAEETKQLLVTGINELAGYLNQGFETLHTRLQPLQVKDKATRRLEHRVSGTTAIFRSLRRSYIKQSRVQEISDEAPDSESETWTSDSWCTSSTLSIASFESSATFFPEQYTLTSKSPPFLVARFKSTVPGIPQTLTEWHVWWPDNPRRWRMIRVSSLDDEEASGSVTVGSWDPKYFWTSPSESQLPCAIEEFERFRIEDGGFSADVTNLSLQRDQSGRATLAWNDNKPYEPDDTTLRSAYRSAKYLMAVEDLGCVIIQEREIIVQEQISGFTTQVLYRGQTCVQKKLPLAPFHLNPFLYEMQALYKLRGCEGIIEFIGVEVDNEKKELLGYLRSCEEMDLTTRLGLGATKEGRIPWSERECWAKQIISGVYNAHSRGIVIGTLDPNKIGVHPSQGARLHHVSHGRCEVGSGCLAPELRHSKGRSLTDADMNARQDIFALGLVLWVLAQTDMKEGIVIDTRLKGKQPWWRRLLCKKSKQKCQYGEVPLEHNLCQESHTDPIDLPTCRSQIPDWYKLAITLCRSNEPGNRPTAKKLLKVFAHRSWNLTAQKRRDSAME